MSLAPQLRPDVLAFAFQMGTELALIAADYGHAEVRIRQAESHLTAPAWMQFRVAWLRFSRMTNPLVQPQPVCRWTGLQLFQVTPSFGQSALT